MALWKGVPRRAHVAFLFDSHSELAHGPQPLLACKKSTSCVRLRLGPHRRCRCFREHGGGSPGYQRGIKLAIKCDLTPHT